MYNNNAAYDFGALEEKKLKQGKIVKLPGSKSRRREKLKAQRILLASAFSVFLVSALSVSAFVLGQARLTEFTDKASKASKELEQCRSINTQLNMKLESSRAETKSSFKDQNAVEIVKVHKNDNAKVS